MVPAVYDIVISNLNPKKQGENRFEVLFKVQTGQAHSSSQTLNSSLAPDILLTRMSFGEHRGPDNLLI